MHRRAALSTGARGQVWHARVGRCKAAIFNDDGKRQRRGRLTDDSLFSGEVVCWQGSVLAGSRSGGIGGRGERLAPDAGRAWRARWAKLSHRGAHRVKHALAGVGQRPIDERSRGGFVATAAKILGHAAAI